MPNQEPYIQIPLCLLSMNCSWRDVLDRMYAYGCWYAATHDPERGIPYFMDWSAGIEWLEEECPEGYWDEECVQVRQGSTLFGSEIPILKLHAVADAFIAARTFLSENGSKDLSHLAQVRVKVSLLLSAQNGGFTEREMRILIAIFSCIGTAEKKWITISTIAARMWGLSSERQMKKVEKSFRRALFTYSQMRTTIANLHRVQCFARVTIGRKTFYSIRMRESTLREQLVRSSLSRVAFRAKQCAENLLMNDTIKASRALLDQKKAV